MDSKMVSSIGTMIETIMREHSGGIKMMTLIPIIIETLHNNGYDVREFNVDEFEQILEHFGYHLHPYKFNGREKLFVYQRS